MEGWGDGLFWSFIPLSCYARNRSSVFPPFGFRSGLGRRARLHSRDPRRRVGMLGRRDPQGDPRGRAWLLPARRANPHPG
jgi:hypothetical protein